MWVICNLLGASLAGSACRQDWSWAGSSCPGAGDPQRPCRHTPRAGAEAPGDTKRVLGQMSYIKWQVMNSR